MKKSVFPYTIHNVKWYIVVQKGSQSLSNYSLLPYPLYIDYLTILILINNLCQVSSYKDEIAVLKWIHSKIQFQAFFYTKHRAKQAIFPNVRAVISIRRVIARRGKYNIAVSFDQAIPAGNICTDTRKTLQVSL